MAVFDPDVVLRNDPAFAPVAGMRVVHGSQAVAKQFAGRAQGARLLFVLELTAADGQITEIDMIADPARLSQLDLAVWDE